MRPKFLKLCQFIGNHEQMLFIILIAFMATWGWGTLYEINHVKPYFFQQTLYLGIAIAAFMLIQLLDLKRLAKSYWIWPPLAVIANVIYSNFGLNRTMLTELYRFNVIAGIVTGMTCLIYFAGLLTKGSRNLTAAIFKEEIVKSHWYQITQKIALAAYIIFLAGIYATGIFVVWFVPLIISCMIILFAIKKYGTGALTAGVSLAFFVSAMNAEPWRIYRFLVARLASESIHKLHSGGIIGSWAVPAASTQWWQFANGDFVFATVGQIHGLLGITCLLLVFLIFGYFGLRAAVRSDNRFSALLVLSMTALILTGVLLSSLSGCGMIGGLGHISIPFFTYGGGDLLLGAIGAGLIFKQLRSKPDANPFPINVSRWLLIMAGLALLIVVKTAVIMV